MWNLVFNNKQSILRIRVSGQVRFRGKDNGRYPFNYLEMIDNIFRKEDNAIEVCSGGMRSSDCFTVDINPDTTRIPFIAFYMDDKVGCLSITLVEIYDVFD